MRETISLMRLKQFSSRLAGVAGFQTTTEAMLVPIDNSSPLAKKKFSEEGQFC